MSKSNENSRFTYITGGTMPPNASSYVERKADYDLLAALLAGEYCYLLDTRQMGKSSLMVRTGVRLREHGVRSAVLDLSAIGQNVTADRWYAGLLARLGEQFNIEDELSAHWRNRAELGGLQRFVEGIRIALNHLGRPLVIFLDEIDAVRSLPFSTDEFFIAIRECYNRRATEEPFERLCFCLIGVATPTDLIRDTRLSPFNIGRRIVLEDFAPEEAALLAQGLVGGNSVLDRILYWTGGHPYLTQRLCRVVAEAPSVPTPNANSPSPYPLPKGEGNVPLTPNTEHRTPTLVDRTCADLFLTHQAGEADDNLAFVRNRLLTSEVDLEALLELYGRIYTGKRVVDTETNPLCSVVKLSGIVRVENGLLRVRNRIYEQVFDKSWIIAHRPDAEVRRQRRAFRRGLALAGAAAGLVLAIIGGLAGIAIRNAERANSLAHEAAAQRALAETERDAAQNLVYVADMSLIPQSYEQNDIGSIQTLLDETRASKNRGFEWGYWNRLCHLDLLTLTARHKGVNVAAFSPDGTLIATGCYDCTVKVWDAASGREMRTLGAAGSRRTGGTYLTTILAVAFSPDGKKILTADHHGTVTSWDSATGAAVRTLKLKLKGVGPFINSVAFSPDCSRIATSCNDGTANVWDANAGREMCTVGSVGSPVPYGWPHTTITAVAISPDNRRLVTGRLDGLANVWDASTGGKILTLNGHGKMVLAAGFSPDGKRIVTGSYDGSAKIWDAALGRNVLTLRGRFGFVRSVVFSPDGTRICTACGDEGINTGSAMVWDASGGSELFTIKGHTDGISSVAYAPDGKRIVTASYDGTSKVWDAASDRKTLSIDGKTNFRSVAFSPNDRQIITSNQDDRAKSASVKVWDAATGRETFTFKGHGAEMTAAISPDGKRIFIGSWDGLWKLFDAASGRETLTIKKYVEPITAVAFSPDSRRIATGCSEGTARVRDASTGLESLTFKGRHNGGITCIAFSSDGKRIVTGSLDSTAKVWDAATGRQLLTLTGHRLGITSVMFSPEGTHVVTCSFDGTVKVWDAATGRETRTLRGNSGVQAAAFSLDGKRIVTGSMDGLAKVWDIASGRELLTLNGHCGWIDSVAFSHDGMRIVAGSNDKTMIVWSAEPCQLSKGDER